MPLTATPPPSGIRNGTCAQPPCPIRWCSIWAPVSGRWLSLFAPARWPPNGTIAGYQFYVSADGTTWGTAVAAGTLAANTSEKTVRFTAKTGRYVRLVALSEMNGKPWTSAAELNIFGAAAPSSTTTTSSLLTQSVTTSPVTSSTSTSTTTVSKSTTTKAPTTVASATSPSSTTSTSQSTTQTASATVSSLTSLIYTHHDREPEHPLGNDADQYENVRQPLY